MRGALLICSLLLLLSCSDAQRRGRRGKKLCSDGELPACADGQDPVEQPRTGRQGGRRRPRLVCEDGSRRACSDSEKPRTCADGSTPERFRPCASGGRPSCPDGNRPTCVDGSRPRKGQCEDGSQATCGGEFGSSTVCDDGSIPATPPTCPAAVI